MNNSVEELRQQMAYMVLLIDMMKNPEPYIEEMQRIGSFLQQSLMTLEGKEQGANDDGQAG